MDIPNCLLHLTDRIIHGSHKADVQAVNSQSVIWEASEQVKSPRGSQCARRKTARAENSEPTAFLGHRARFGTMPKGIPSVGELFAPFIHSQIIIATIERPNCISLGAPSLVNTLHLTDWPRPPPHNAILVRCEAVSTCARGRRFAGRGGSRR
jgi:hypothetical protein